MTDNENIFINGEICDRMVQIYLRGTDNGDFQILRMGSRRSDNLDGRTKSLKRLKSGMKRRNTE